MANLGNSKIKDTYQRVLQITSSGNLQKLDGTTPSLVFNSPFKYNVGGLADGYVLKSDSSGNASWGAVAFSGDVYISGGSIEGTTIELNASSGGTVSVPGLSWSSSTSGHISNSGLTGNVGIGTSTPNKPLTVVGDISGTTDLYLGSATHTASTITAQESLTIKGRGVDNDYMILKENSIDFHIDGNQLVRFMPGVFDFNSSGYDYDFKINGEDQLIFQVYGESGQDRIRIKDHLAIGGNAGVSHAESVKFGLAVTGSSLFYSGGTSISGNAITAVGNISGTTDLYIDGNMYSGTTNLLDIFASSGITNQDVYWSATTDGDITTSGNTDVRISGNTYVSGDTHTTNLVLAAGGYIMPAASSNTIKMRAQNYDGEMLSVGPDLLQVNMNSAANFQITPTQVTFNSVGVDQSFRIRTDTGNFTVESDGVYDLLTFSSQGGTSIGGTTKRWPTDSGYAGSVPNKTLQVNGITTIYSGGTGNVWSGDTTALRVVGDISGATDLRINGNMYSGTTNLLDIFSTTGGTVTNVTGTAPVVSTGGNTPAISVTTSAVTNGSANLSTGDQIYDFVAAFTAPAANRIAVTDDETSNTTFEVPYGAAPAASVSLLSSSRLTYNPYDRNLTSINFTGNLVGTATTATTVLVTDNESDNDNNLLVFVGDGVDTTGAQSLQMDGDLYYNPSIGKLHVPLTIQMPDNGTIKLGDSQDLKLYHDGDDSYIKENGTGDLIIQTNSNVIIEGVGGENCAVFVDEGGVELYYDNTKKFETTNDGVTLFNNANISGNTLYVGTISGTGRVTAVGGFVGEVTGNASTATKIASITNNDIVQLDSTQTLTNKTLTSPVFNTGISGTAFLDEDDMASNSANKVASQQSIVSFINKTRMDWMKTTGGIKLLSSDNWVGFNRTTGGLDSSGFWNADCGGTALSNVHAFYGSYYNTVFTAPYGGHLKRLIIQGANTTNAGAVGEDWNIYLAKSPVVNDSDSISWSQVTAFTRTLPEDRNKRFIYDIPLNGTTGVAISQYDTFLLAFQGTNATNTWITANMILEFEYEI